MFIRHALVAALSATTLGLTGCLDSSSINPDNANPDYRINADGRIQLGTHPLFSPLDTEFVIPSDALFFLSEVDDGTMLNGTDPDNPVTDGIGYLDGASVLAPIDVKISASVDDGQELDARGFVELDGEVVPNRDQNVFLIPVEYAGGDALKPKPFEAAGLTPAARYREAVRLKASGVTENVDKADEIFEDLLTQKVRVELLDIDGGQNNMIRVLPVQPLAEKTKYILALTNDIIDAQGEPLVGSPTYQTVADPERTLSNAGFQPFRDAMVPARRLAADYFDFKREILGSRDFSATFADVTYATSITTTAVDDVLLANAAPVTFFRATLERARRQAELKRLVDGDFYNLSGQPVAGATVAEQNFNDALYATLIDPGFRLYNRELAVILEAANAAEPEPTAVFYGDLVADVERDRRIAHAIQVAAAEAIYTEAFATFKTDIDDQALSLAADADPILDTPRARDVVIFSQRDGGDVNDALAQSFQDTPVNIHVYEGAIKLPYYLAVPEADNGSVIKTESWTSADFASSESLTAAPSERVSYRFPFAKKTADTVVPLVVAAPDTDSSLPFFDPPDADGYPVIIYQHAATQDRSAILTLATAAGLTCARGQATPTDPSDDRDCFVTVGIDLPLHGIFDRTPENEGDEDGTVGLNPIAEQKTEYGVGEGPGLVPAEATERHFGFTADADLNPVTPSELPNPKASADNDGPESGSLFLNFANYANTRDNIRQGALDLLNLNASLQAIDDAISACWNGGAGDCASDLNINPNRVYFMTHSLSGMGGAAFHHVTNAAIDALGAGNTDLKEITASMLLNTGGQFTRLIENSPAVAPLLLPGLDQASDGLLAQGRTEMNIYFNVFQAQLDTADPTAFAPFYKGKKVLLTEINGAEGDPDNAEAPTDSTIPNAADADASAEAVAAAQGEDLLRPLSTTLAETGFEIKGENMPLTGTDPMARAMVAAAIQADAGANSAFPIITRYTEGSHGNPISAGQKDKDPFSSRAVFDEMSAQMLELFTRGTVSVSNGCVVQGTEGTDCANNSDPGEAPEESEGGNDGGAGGDGGSGAGEGGGGGDAGGIVVLPAL